MDNSWGSVGILKTPFECFERCPEGCELRLHPSAERPACRSDGAKIRKFPPPQILDQIIDHSTCIRYFYRIYRLSGVRIGQRTERPIEFDLITLQAQYCLYKYLDFESPCG